MPELEYFLVSRGISLDRFSNAISIFDVVEEVTPRRFPALLIRLAAVAGWNASDAEMTERRVVSSRIIVRAPGRDQQETDLSFTAETRRHRAVAIILGLQITEPGEIVCVLECDGQERAHHRIWVNAADPLAPPDGWMMYQPGPAEIAQGEASNAQSAQRPQSIQNGS